LRSTGTTRATQPCWKKKSIGADCTAEPDLTFHDEREKFLYIGEGV